MRDGRIAFVGTAAEVAKQAPADARRLDLTGRTIVPGLTDAHVHLAGVGQRELSFNLEGTASLDELQTRLGERVAKAGRGQWIEGRGWIEAKWSPPTFPTAADLDVVAPNHPVSLARSDGHAIVVNTFALKLAGITRTTPNPSGGEIVRDARTGEATGMLVDKAKALVERLVPVPASARSPALLKSARPASYPSGGRRSTSRATASTRSARCAASSPPAK